MGVSRGGAWVFLPPGLLPSFGFSSTQAPPSRSLALQPTNCKHCELKEANLSLKLQASGVLSSRRESG